jgi:hypothetical protein
MFYNAIYKDKLTRATQQQQAATMKLVANESNSDIGT